MESLLAEFTDGGAAEKAAAWVWAQKEFSGEVSLEPAKGHWLLRVEAEGKIRKPWTDHIERLGGRLRSLEEAGSPTAKENGEEEATEEAPAVGKPSRWNKRGRARARRSG